MSGRVMNIKEINIKKIFTDSDVITCSPSTSLGDAVKMMTDQKVGAICIVEHERIIGIFTERDFLLHMGKSGDSGILDQEICNFMTENPKTIKESASIYNCMVYMRVGSFRHVIVVDEEERPLKMVSIRDAFFFLCDELTYD